MVAVTQAKGSTGFSAVSSGASVNASFNATTTNGSTIIAAVAISATSALFDGTCKTAAGEQMDLVGMGQVTDGTLGVNLIIDLFVKARAAASNSITFTNSASSGSVNVVFGMIEATGLGDITPFDRESDAGGTTLSSSTAIATPGLAPHQAASLGIAIGIESTGSPGPLPTMATPTSWTNIAAPSQSLSPFCKAHFDYIITTTTTTLTPSFGACGTANRNVYDTMIAFFGNYRRSQAGINNRAALIRSYSWCKKKFTAVPELPWTTQDRRRLERAGLSYAGAC